MGLFVHRPSPPESDRDQREGLNATVSNFIFGQNSKEEIGRREGNVSFSVIYTATM